MSKYYGMAKQRQKTLNNTNTVSMSVNPNDRPQNKLVKWINIPNQEEKSEKSSNVHLAENLLPSTVIY